MAYKLYKAIGINFANLNKREFYFQGSLTLLVGENGSGKSTFQDMIQIIMTGDTSNIINYNAGQSEDDTRKRNERKRSFASYLLGADQLKFTRNEALGVVALVFKNDIDGKKFTAWIYGEAEVEGGKNLPTPKGGVQELGFCFNEELNSNDFMENEDPKGNIKDIKKLKEYLKNKVKGNLLICDSKQEYLMKLYGNFNGLNSISYNEAKKAAKAFVKYIFPTKTDNINKFVSQELLEKDDLNSVINSLKDAISSFNKIEQEAIAIEESEKSLDSVIKCGIETINSWKEHIDLKYLVEKRKSIRLTKKTIDDNKKLSQFKGDLNTKENTIKNLKEKTIPDLSKTKEDLEKSLEGNENIVLKEQFDERMIKLNEDENTANNTITSLFETYEELHLRLKSTNEIIQIHEYCNVNLLDKLNEASESHLNINDRLNLYSNINNELDFLLDVNGEFMKKLDIEADLVRNKFKELDAEVQSLFNEVDSFELTGETRYPNQRDIDIIKEAFPRADAAPLCEYLDIKNKDWQRAIEGFLGGNRFAIVVDGDYEVEVTNFLKEKKLKSKIIQGNKVLSDSEKYHKVIKPDSILSLLEFSNPIAEAYMILNYGNVLQVKTTLELTRAQRGLKSDGLAASGYTTFECLAKKSDCFIGEASKYERHVVLTEELREKQKVLTPLRAKKDKLVSLEKWLNKVTLEDLNPLQLKKEDISKEIKSINEKLKLIDISKEQEKINEIKKLDKRINELEEEQGQAREDIGFLKNEIGNKIKVIEDDMITSNSITKRIDNLEEEIRVAIANDSNNILEKIEKLDIQARESYKNTELAPMFDSTIKNNLIEYERISNEHNMKSVELALIPDAKLYNSVSDNIESYKKIYAYFTEQKTVHRRLSSNVLKNKRIQLENARDDFNKSFKDEFCNRVYNSIAEGKEKVRRLNLMLKKHKFANEKFVIKEPFFPKYKEYYDYFEYVVLSNRDALGYEKNVLPEEFIETKEIIDSLLLESDDTEAKKELKNISDYRNYKEYDIHKVFDDNEENSISLSDLATDSGGQATTSYYIIRSIAAYSSFDKDNKRCKTGGLGFLLIDEAFNRVDDKRTGDMINYLKDSLGFQLIAAMPTKDESILMPFATDRYNLYKEIRDNSYENYQIKQFATYEELDQDEIRKLFKKDEDRIREKMSLFDVPGE
ncbi:SbcC/MukB-like Walker B domain-containing protein [Arcobacter peruensis]|uniref:SbcC/MukB-like Walker B domain-containing protein n=1 Tax=Arcobacter peruensis TaxID=2320140 RepID=UPI000F07B51D|nr:SbcC/MukB-like Walker B domain-containing protein [Arcobacter peruensis]